MSGQRPQLLRCYCVVRCAILYHYLEAPQAIVKHEVQVSPLFVAATKFGPPKPTILYWTECIVWILILPIIKDKLIQISCLRGQIIKLMMHKLDIGPGFT